MTITYLYECPDRRVMFDTGIDQKTLTNTKNKLQAAGKMHFYKDWVYISNGERYQSFKGETNDKAKIKIVEQLPKDVLDWYYSINDTTQILPRYSLKPKPKPKSQSYKEPKSYSKKEEIDIDEVYKALEGETN